MSALWVEEVFAGLDWYGRDLSGETYRGCTFREVDLTEMSAPARSCDPPPLSTPSADH